MVGRLLEEFAGHLQFKYAPDVGYAAHAEHPPPQQHINLVTVCLITAQRHLLHACATMSTRLYPYRWGSGNKPFEGTFVAKPLSAAVSDFSEFEGGDKIVLPEATLRDVKRLRLPFPLLFEVSNGGRRNKASVLQLAGCIEFSAPTGVSSRLCGKMDVRCVHMSSSSAQPSTVDATRHRATGLLHAVLDDGKPQAAIRRQVDDQVPL